MCEDKIGSYYFDLSKMKLERTFLIFYFVEEWVSWKKVGMEISVNKSAFQFKMYYTKYENKINMLEKKSFYLNRFPRTKLGVKGMEFGDLQMPEVGYTIKSRSFT